MKKIFIVIFGVALVGVIGYYGWLWNKAQLNQLTSTSVKNSTENTFQITGVLTRNNPGLKTGVWFLISDLPGAAATQFELGFDLNSECYLGSKFFDCNNLDLPNGTRVRVSGSRNLSLVSVKDLTAEENSDLISIDKLNSGDKIQSPLTITGRARGNWYFEASFPIFLKDFEGKVVTTTIATAQSDWMTTDFVPFVATLSFEAISETPAELILAADNPSGLPQFDREIKIAVTLLPPANLKIVNLYYYNSILDSDATGNVLCSDKGLVEVKRGLPNNDQLIFKTVELLLAGNISELEKNQGISTEYPLDGLKLNSVNIEGGIAVVSLTDTKNKTTGGSCRVSILWKQIEKTIKQFPGIKEVKFIPEVLFQP